MSFGAHIFHSIMLIQYLEIATGKLSSFHIVFRVFLLYLVTVNYLRNVFVNCNITIKYLWSHFRQAVLNVRPLYQNSMFIVLLMIETPSSVQHHHVQIQVTLLLLLLLLLLLVISLLVFISTAAFSSSPLVVPLRLGGNEINSSETTSQGQLLNRCKSYL